MPITVNMWYHSGSKKFPVSETAHTTSVLKTALIYRGARNIGHMSLHIDCYDPEQIEKIKKEFANFKHGFETTFTYERIERPEQNKFDPDLTQYDRGKLIPGMRLTISFWPARIMVGKFNEEREVTPLNFLGTVPANLHQHLQDMRAEAPTLDEEEMRKRVRETLEREGVIEKIREAIVLRNPNLEPADVEEMVEMRIENQLKSQIIKYMIIEHDVSFLLETIENMRQENSVIYDKKSALHKQIQSLEKQREQLNQEIEALKKIPVKFASSKATIETKLQRLRNKVDEINQKLYALQQQCQSLEDIFNSNEQQKDQLISFMLERKKTEGVNPDISFSLSGTNSPAHASEYDTFVKELKILQAFNQILIDKKGYQIITHNCATTVKECLLAGINDTDKALINELYNRDRIKHLSKAMRFLRKKPKDFFRVANFENPAKVFAWTKKLRAYMDEILKTRHDEAIESKEMQARKQLEQVEQNNLEIVSDAATNAPEGLENLENNDNNDQKNAKNDPQIANDEDEKYQATQILKIHKS